MYQRNKIANLISKLNFYKLITYPMDRQSPPNRPPYQLTRGLNRFRQRKRCYNVTLSRQEGSMMCHLATAVGPADQYAHIQCDFFCCLAGRSMQARPSNCPPPPISLLGVLIGLVNKKDAMTSHFLDRKEV